MEKEDIDKFWLQTLSECNEVQRRRLAGVKALELGWGGLTKVCKLTGMSHHTVIKGIIEVKKNKKEPIIRQRKKGGGRKKLVEKNPAVKKEIERILENNTAGDPMSPLKWTHKSTYAITRYLISKNIVKKISEDTIGKIMKEQGYTLQANKKSKEGGSPPERDSQFKYINTKVKSCFENNTPIISVDTKKKELVGNFKNPGQRWLKKGKTEIVNVYDFESLGKGKAIPYGIYDIQQNNGFVNVGIDHNTAEFAVESITQWWKHIGEKNYSNTKELFITADCGGGNGNKNTKWKYFLQQFANKNKLKVTVSHYPPGTSKWNKIEHKMFSFITMNWKGKPLISYEIIIKLIKSTKTQNGLKIDAKLDRKKYEKAKEIPGTELNKINLQQHSTNPLWNYTITPNN